MCPKILATFTEVTRFKHNLTIELTWEVITRYITQTSFYFFQNPEVHQNSF